MATTMRPTDSISELDLPLRAHSALWRNGVREVGELVKAEIEEMDRIHALGQPLTEREAAKADAVAEGNPEGFSSEPEPLPDAFTEDDK